MRDAPGTVSKILWHFTGGPTWNAAANRQNKMPKPAAHAYEALVGILASRELRLGSYKEVVKVRVPIVREYDYALRRTRVRRNVLTTLQSAAVCCLADIPVAHLSYHAARYGKLAVGFHRESVIRHGFNPVFYTLHHGSVMQSIYAGFAEIGSAFDADAIRAQADVINSEAESSGIYLGWESSELNHAADDIEDAVAAMRQSVESLLSLVKTFAPHEFGTIYCEREWRATTAFNFAYGDVAMIVAPRKLSGQNYARRLVAEEAERLGLPRSIPVVAWEDLVES